VRIFVFLLKDIYCRHMNDFFKDYRSLLTEKGILIVIIAVMAFLWSINQLSLLALLVIGGTSAGLLIQLEFKRRVEELKIRRVAAQEKRISKEKGVQSLRANALNGVPSPILLINANNIITFANDTAKELLGSEIVTNDVFLYLRQSNFVAALDKVLSNETSDVGAIRYTNSQGRSFDVTLGPVSDSEANSNSIQAIAFFYEVTSLLRTEQMRVDFVANASHELRTPLTSITGFIETLQGPAQDDMDAHKRFLDIMSREADRMIRLIDDLLSLSQIEMTRHLSPDNVIDIASLVQSIITTFTPRAVKRGITFQTNLADVDLPKVKADADQITQVLVNLIGNATKYADQDTTIHVTSTPGRNGKNLVLTVRDEGPGISMEHLGRLTERFYRVDTARSRKMGGTGLGLAIVKHILLRHGSQLDIKSQIGHGTAFSFKLPFDKD